MVGLGEAADGYASGVFGLGRLGLPNVPPPQRIRRGGHVQQALLIRRVQPVYPAEAIEQSIAGLVVLEAIIGVDGSIHELKVISGDPLLAASTVEAVTQWRYRPTALNGTAVEVVTRIEVTFKFQEPESADGKKESKKRRGASRDYRPRAAANQRGRSFSLSHSGSRRFADIVAGAGLHS